MKRPKNKPRAAEQKRQEKQTQRRQQQQKKRDQKQKHKPKQSKPKPGNATVGKESRADGTGSQANLPADSSYASSALAERAFVTTRDRDAWATIDGFVYQVVITIERWLSLSDNEALELECGEDIDVVVDSIANAQNDAARFRRLEQVKRLSANVTLRSPPIVEFLASAVEHRQNNPGTTLRFRFVSTASVATERPSPYRPAIAAIPVWTRLSRAYDPKGDTDALAGIRAVLRSVRRPDDFSDKTWTTYRTFVRSADDNSVLAFLASVEWTLESGDRREVERSIQSALVARKLVPSEDAAESAYRSLFFEVFRSLSKPGLKRLTPADLTTALNNAPRTSSEVATELRLLAVLSTHDLRISRAEEQLAAHRNRLDQLAQLQQLPARVRPAPTTFSPPPLVSEAVARPQLSAEIATALTAASVVSLRGEAGYGKTHAAAMTLPGATWARLRHLPPRDAAFYVSEARKRAKRVRHSYVVLDDLPRINSGDELVEQVLALHRDGFKTLITTPFDLPELLKGELGDDLAVITAPPMSAEEVREALMRGGATNLLSEEGVAIVISLTMGHPTLVRAFVAYMKRQQWRLDEEVASSIFAGDFAKGARVEAARLLRETVLESGRDLIYRLDLVDGPIERRHIEAVSTVAPTIPLPHEKVDDAKGLWLQESARGELALSPLLEGIGTEFLERKLRETILSSLAEVLLHQKTITATEAQRALDYLVGAGEFNRAGFLYVTTVSAFIESSPTIPVPSFITRWMRNLPTEIPASTRAFVRSTQLRLAHQRGQDETRIAADLSAILNSVDPSAAQDVEALTLAMSALTAISYLSDATAKQSLRFATIAAALLQRPSAIVTGIPAAGLESLLGAFWSAAAHARTPSDIREWCALVRALTPEQAQLSASRTKFALDVMHFVPRFAALDAPNRDLAIARALDAALNELEEVALERGLPFLAASARAARILAHGEVFKDIDKASELAREGLSRFGADAASEFTLREAVGSQYAFAGRTNEARDELARAVDIDTDVAPIERLHALLRLGVITADTKYPVRAVDYAKKEQRLPRSELARAYGELALAREESKAGDALQAWGGGAEQLLAETNQDATHKGLFALFGHALGYYVAIVATGEALTTTLSGGIYGRPWRGMFLRDLATAAPAYRDGRRALLAAQVETYADAIGEDATAMAWSETAARLAESEPPEIQAVLVRTLVPYLIRRNAFAQAVDSAVSAVDSTPIPGGLPEVLARNLAVLPSHMRAATLMITDDPLAVDAAVGAVTACRARFAKVQDPRWDLAADIIDASLLNKGDRTRLRSLEVQAQASNDHCLKAMSAIATSLEKQTSLEEAALAHITLGYYLDTYLRETVAASAHITLPFLYAFWRRAYDESAHLFVAPRSFEHELDAVKDKIGTQAIRRLFRALLAAFPSIRMPMQLRAWTAAE